MKRQRIDRINSLLKEVIFEVIQKEVRNPHINTFVTVTKVETSADLHHAKVYISLVTAEEEKEKVLQALQSASGFIAVNASHKVQLRYFPELIFKLDTGLDDHMKIEKILYQIEVERRSREVHEDVQETDS